MKSITLYLALCAVLASTSPLFADYETDFQTKADIIIDWVADVYQTPGGDNPYDDQSDPEKYTGPKINARFTKYGVADAGGDPLGTYPPNAVNANDWLEQGIIQSGGSPNLFHFRFLGLAGNLAMFSDAPGATGVYDSPVIDGSPTNRTYADAYTEAVMTRTDNYNAFTGEGTMNHINMNRPSAWIFCKLAQDSAYYAARRADDPANYPDPVAKEAEMRDYLKSWARQLYTVGGVEYDSSVYGVFNVAPWVNLYEATLPACLDDPELNTTARAVLDWYAAAMALKYRYGVVNGASVRGEGKMDRYDRDDETDFLLWLWFGDPADVPTELANTTVRVEHQPITAVYAATSSYRPPAVAVALADKTGMENTQTRHGRSNYLMSKASESLEQYYVGASYTLGAAQFPYGGWASAVYRVNPWKLVTSTGAYSPAVIAGNNGLRAAKYCLRNPWMQVVQDRNVILQLNYIHSGAQAQYDAAINLVETTWLENWYNDFTARFSSPDWGGFQGLSYAGRQTPVNSQDDGNVPNARTSYIWFEPGLTATASSGSVRFGQFGDTFFAIRSVDGSLPVYSSSSRYFSSFADYDNLGGLIMEAGSAADAEYDTFAEFQSYYLSTTSLSTNGLEVTYTAMDGRVITATYQLTGEYTEPEYDWSYGVTEPVSKMFLPSYDTGASPPESWTLPTFPNETGTGRVASWSVDPDGAGPLAAESFDSSTVWPVFDGPNLKLMNRVLHVWDGSSLYSVDYSGDAPVFSEGALPVPKSAISVVGANATIEWPTVPGLLYQVQRSEDLSPPWVNVGDPVLGDGTTKQLNGGAISTGEAAFWRIEITFD
ncbi:MAG: hypothetical protein ACP5I4_11345 [Oceanipulchritudo sp.]